MGKFDLDDIEFRTLGLGGSAFNVLRQLKLLILIFALELREQFTWPEKVQANLPVTFVNTLTYSVTCSRVCL